LHDLAIISKNAGVFIFLNVTYLMHTYTHTHTPHTHTHTHMYIYSKDSQNIKLSHDVRKDHFAASCTDTNLERYCEHLI